MKSEYIVLTFKVWPEDDQFVSRCDELGTASCGDTVDEAIENLREAVLLYVETLEELGQRKRVFRERNIPVRSSSTLRRRSLPVGVGEIITRQCMDISRHCYA